MAPIGGGLAPAEVQAIAAIGGAPPPAAAPAAARPRDGGAAGAVRARRPARRARRRAAAARRPGAARRGRRGVRRHALLRVLDSPARNTLAASAAAFAAGSLADGRDGRT